MNDEQQIVPVDTTAVQELVNINDNMIAIQAQIIEATREFHVQLAEYQDQDRKLRAAIQEGFEQSGAKNYEDDNIKLVYIKPTVRKGIDTTKLKALRPDVYAEFEKETPVKGSVRITLK